MQCAPGDCEGRRVGGRQRDGAAVEHEDDRRHGGPELRVLLDTECHNSTMNKGVQERRRLQ
jgi:hypothetical protein